MNIYEITYNIPYKKDSNYLVIADFHGDFNTKTAYKIKENKAKFIIIAGDILNGYNWVNKRKLDKLRSFLNIIKENHIIIICLGNHDLWRLSDEGFKNFKSLKDENIYPLFNETCIIDGESFTNFLPSKKCFSYKKQEKKETISKIIDEYDKLEIQENSNHIRHLISHNPFHFFHNDIINRISNNYDIIETGHFHDGWIPTKILSKSYDKCLDKGLHEFIRNNLFKTNHLKLTVKPKRIMARGIIYSYIDGYFVLLPNNTIYFFNKEKCEYRLSNKEELGKRLSNIHAPAIIVAGAINTFLKLKIFYPQLTNITLSKEDFEAKTKIEKI